MKVHVKPIVDPHWTVPLMWEGQTIAILASGESMSAEVAEQIRQADIPTIVINTTFRLAPWASMLYGADKDWWLHSDNKDALSFAGMKVSCSEVARGVLHIRYSGSDGLDPDRSFIRTGINSGYQALHIAVHAGASKVLLFGFDMQGRHWHKDHPRPLRDTAPGTFVKWVQAFTNVAPILRERGVDVVNCSGSKSILDCFRRSTLENEIAKSTKSVAA
jgi:hypothetical protein